MATVTFIDAAATGNLAGTLATQYAVGGTPTAPTTGDTINVLSTTLPLVGDCTAGTFSGIVPAIWNFRGGSGGTGTAGGWTGRKIGTPTTAVTLSASTSATIKGGGLLDYVNLSAGTSGNKVAKLTIKNVPTVVLTTGTIDDVRFENCGTVVIGAGVVFLSARFSGCGQVSIESNGTKPTKVIIIRSTVRDARGSANSSSVTVGQGGLLIREGTSSNGNSSSVMEIAGRLNDQSSGVLYNAEIFSGGTLDPTGSTKDLTWTVIRPWQGSNVVRTDPSITVTITGEDPIGG